jgi:hypothetical protein
MTHAGRHRAGAVQPRAAAQQQPSPGRPPRAGIATPARPAPAAPADVAADVPAQRAQWSEPDYFAGPAPAALAARPEIRDRDEDYYVDDDVTLSPPVRRVSSGSHSTTVAIRFRPPRTAEAWVLIAGAVMALSTLAPWVVLPARGAMGLSLVEGVLTLCAAVLIVMSGALAVVRGWRWPLWVALACAAVAGGCAVAVSVNPGAAAPWLTAGKVPGVVAGGPVALLQALTPKAGIGVWLELVGAAFVALTAALAPRLADPDVRVAV